MSAGVLDEVAVRPEAHRPGFEPTRAERLRIWGVCLILAAAVQLAVVCALAPGVEPRYAVQFEAIERRPMFVPSRFEPGATNRAATEHVGARNRAATERAVAGGAMNRAATERAVAGGAMNRAATERAAAAGAMNRAATERAATERAATERAATERVGAMNRAATERAATERAATERAATERAATERAVHRRGSVDARFIAQVGTNDAAGGDLAPGTGGSTADEAGEARTTPQDHGDSPAPSPHTAPTLTSETTPGLWADAVGTQVSRGLRYPRAAEEDGVEGVALLRLHVEADGRIVSVELVRSSGDERLDEAALARARTLERLPPPPHGTRAIDVPVHFRLP